MSINTFKLSDAGKRMSQLTGVRAILKDIGDALRTTPGKNMINLSAGNPVVLPEVRDLWIRIAHELADQPEFPLVVGRYGASQGYEPFIQAIVTEFNKRYKLKLTEKNVLVTPGTQAIIFYAANAYGGNFEDKLKQVVLPLCPDYTGYGGVTLNPEAVVSYRPNLEIDEKSHRFKYRPDFKTLEINQNTGCVIFSRPSNPTGNVLSDQEVKKIADQSLAYNVPIILDSAYGPPIPALHFTPMTPVFGPNIVHCMSFSKAGLPGERLGVAIGPAEIIEVLQAFQANVCIHSSRFGQALAAEAIKSGALAQISEQVIQPFYRKKFSVLEQAVDQNFSKELPWFLHRGEGALFAWLWCKDLPISSWELYRKLKASGVVIVPGKPFFPGLKQDWKHSDECIRISLTASDDHIQNGIAKIGQTISELYAQGGPDRDGLVS
jgi:valine--pyruvate aminotransferase